MKICISSGKGGVGKTSLVVNLAYCLANKGRKVLMVDGDLGLANVDVMLGISATKTISDVMDRGADPLEALVELERNLSVLPASSGAPDLVTLGPEEQNVLGRYLDDMVQKFDILIADTAAGIGPSVRWFNHFVDYNVVVATPDPTSLTDSYALMKVLKQEHDLREFQLVLNLVRSPEQGKKTFTILADAAKKFLNLDLKYLGCVLEDTAVPLAIRNQRPLVLSFPSSPASISIKELGDKILSW